MAHQAVDSFNMDMPDGSQLTVHKGQVFPDSHPLVRHDRGRGVLFAALEADEPARRPRGRPRKDMAVPGAEVPDENGDEGGEGDNGD